MIDTRNPIIGAVVRDRNDTLSLRDAAATRHTIAWQSIRRVDLSVARGFDAKRGVQGALIGAGAGLAFAVTALVDCTLGSDLGGRCTDQGLGESVVLMAGSAAVGALIGAAWSGGGSKGRRWGMIGAVVGAPIGLVAALATHESCGFSGGLCSPGVQALGGTVFGAAAGGFVGLLVGGFSGGDRWLTVFPMSLSINVVPWSNGVTVLVSVP